MKLGYKPKTIQEQTDIALGIFAEAADVIEALSKQAEEQADNAYLEAIECTRREEYYRNLHDKNAAIAENIRKIFSH